MMNPARVIAQTTSTVFNHSLCVLPMHAFVSLPCPLLWKSCIQHTPIPWSKKFGKHSNKLREKKKEKNIAMPTLFIWKRWQKILLINLF
jgi:hypothetical protein